MPADKIELAEIYGVMFVVVTLPKSATKMHTPVSMCCDIVFSRPRAKLAPAVVLPAVKIPEDAPVVPVAKDKEVMKPVDPMAKRRKKTTKKPSAKDYGIDE